VELYLALDRLRFDRRMLDRSIQDGLMTEKDLDEHLKALPDLSSQALRVDWDAESQNGAHHN